MKKKTIIPMLLSFSLQGTAQNLGMCTYDVAGNRLSRFTYVEDRGRNSQSETEREGQVDLANERLGNHAVQVLYDSETSTLVIDVLGLDDSDKCSAYIYNLTGQMIYRQKINTVQAEINLYDYNNGVYILRIELNGESKCWKIIKK